MTLFLVFIAGWCAREAFSWAMQKYFYSQWRVEQIGGRVEL